jgi:hypothetical protein
LIKERWTDYRKAVVNSFLLLLPGAISSLLIFFIASNRLFPNDKDHTLSLLNFYQLQMLGITVAKYGIDQMVISRLNPNHQTNTNAFFTQRVFPLTLLFCIVIGFIKGWVYAAFLALILPMEVMSILISVEWSVSNKIKFTSILTLLGNPLAFILIYLVYKKNLQSVNIMFACFLLSSLIRITLALFFRNKGSKTEIAILSYNVPLQQIGNYFMFRFDQVVIAMSLGIAFLGNKLLMGQYLFLAKFPEVASGVIVSLAPLLYRQLGNQVVTSLKNLFKNRIFLLMSICICICQLAVTFFVFKPRNMDNNILLFVPFVISSLLVLPTNMVTYFLLKKAAIAKINILNLISCITGVIILFISLLCANVYLFSLVVPMQLLIYIIFYQLLYYEKQHNEPDLVNTA